MEYERLLALWDQRIVLLTSILDLTKQIEAQSCQEDIQLGDLPEQRQVYLDRLKKCNRIIDASVGKADPENRARLKSVLAANPDLTSCTQEERRLAAYAQESRRLLDSILASDTEARRKIRLECDRLRKLARSSRKKTPSGPKPEASNRISSPVQRT